MSTRTFHPGERAVQARAGVQDRADHVGRGIGAVIPAVAARFLSERRTLVVGAADHDGRLWAGLLSGPAGFLAADGERTLAVAARPAPGDPLASVLTAPAEVGTIALDPAGRRRMRLNGRAVPDGRGGLRITAEQVYANCPKYIQRRHPLDTPSAPALVGSGTRLSTRQQLAASTADTFFIASSGPDGGVDASHRGGNPGFLTVHGPGLLSWPDYPGNNMFMTLGNLELHPAAGLLLPDWETGGALMLSGRAEPDADRTVWFTVERVVELAGAAPLRWTEPEYSPANPPSAPSAQR
ncbi:pyridoxamine 5'-phosphate oxidase family protein [Kitasatospora sp. NPDC002040]|uniref:pyridoxamine 5'-phosphate oxidase family protein n=1 Tax=Kitasatospora sp. NPDC002040 TaxID=3154661 RepID=UPI00332D46DD